MRCKTPVYRACYSMQCGHRPPPHQVDTVRPRRAGHVPTSPTVSCHDALFSALGLFSTDSSSSLAQRFWLVVGVLWTYIHDHTHRQPAAHTPAQAGAGLQHRTHLSGKAKGSRSEFSLPPERQQAPVRYDGTVVRVILDLGECVLQLEAANSFLLLVSLVQIPVPSASSPLSNRDSF